MASKQPRERDTKIQLKSAVTGDSSLQIYRSKRAAGRTTEPFGGAPRPGTARRFVVHHHAARQLHYDLRLEHDGVLLSWAVPKGPSPSPGDLRFAARVEEHPLEYGSYEGVIPEGNYGAGATIVWDAGAWIPIGDPDEGLARGKLLFELRGFKLRGRWTLVKTKRGRGDWLLIKERDAEVREGGTEGYPADSVLSGHTVETLAGGVDLGAPIRAVARRRRAPRWRSEVIPAPMLASRAQAPFDRAGWLFEVKYDGYRMLAARRGGSVALLSRNRAEVTGVFPEIRAAVAALPFPDLVLDGEVVVHGEGGLPSFARLQARAKLTRAVDIERAAAAHPAVLYVIDVLAFADFDLRPLRLDVRKAALREILPSVGRLRYSEHVERAGAAMYREVSRLGLEGIVAKDASSPYRSGRSQAWLKVVADRRRDVVVAGYTLQPGGRALGALCVAEWEDGRLRYRGRVGSGFTEAQRERLLGELEGAPPADPPDGAPRGGGCRWRAPMLVAEIRFKTLTSAGHLRQPVFVRRRDDKGPEECVAEADASEPAEPPERPPRPARRRPGKAKSALTNIQKMFWPAEGYTKGDLLAYYRKIGPWILPYLRDRPVVLTRYPDGVEGKSFFQHDAPDYARGFVRLERIWSGHREREISSFIVEDSDALEYLVNLGAIPLHVWSSRLGRLERPDWCVLDLDPKGAPFAHVVRIARRIGDLCASVELPAYPKTSGSTGLHVQIPVGGQLTHEQSRSLAELLARIVVLAEPEISTLARRVSHRAGKVYLDCGQNGHGRLVVCPFAVRPLPGAPVAMPLRWPEVRPGLESGRYTIQSAPRRMRSLRRDPLAPVLDEVPDLGAVLEALGREVAGR